jgi:hypothetical protein
VPWHPLTISPAPPHSSRLPAPEPALHQPPDRGHTRPDQTRRERNTRLQ